MGETIPLNACGEQFLRCLSNADHQTFPFDYWLLSEALPARVCHAIADLPFAPPQDAEFDGRRESNNASRVYFGPANQAQYPVMKELVEAFKHPKVIAAIEKTCGIDLAKGQLRIEYCQDVDGFWLEPHLDISVKLFTMLVYLADDPKLLDAGTDIYDASPEHTLVARAPCEFNKGLIFIPGTNTWHGFARRPITGLRKSIIVNYVAPEWRAVHELS